MVFVAQVPSVGRVVHYLSRGSADGVFLPVCRAAIVTDVPAPPADSHGSLVDLVVLNPSGIFFDRNVPRDDTNTRGGTWHEPERAGTEGDER